MKMNFEVINYILKALKYSYRYYILAWKFILRKEESTREEYFWALPGFLLSSYLLLNLFPVDTNIKILGLDLYTLVCGLTCVSPLLLITAKRLNDANENLIGIIIFLLSLILIYSKFIIIGICIGIPAFSYLIYQLIQPTRYE